MKQDTKKVIEEKEEKENKNKLLRIRCSIIVVHKM